MRELIQLLINLIYLACSMLYFIFALATAMIGYQLRHDVVMALVNFVFAPLSWVVWLVRHEVNLTVLKQTFGFLLT